MNVFASAGGAARAENDLNMLYLNSRKRIREENQLLNKIPGEKDSEKARQQNNKLMQSLDPLKAQILDYQEAKMVIAIIQIVAPFVMAALSSSNSQDGQNQSNTETAAANNSANVQWGMVLNAAVGLGQQYIAYQNLKADREKLNKNRGTLAMEAASVDAALQQLDTSGVG